MQFFIALVLVSANPDPESTAVRIVIQSPQGIGYTSGVVVQSSATQAVILTCYHSIRQIGNNSKITVNLYKWDGKNLAYAESRLGQVIDQEPNSDLAIIAIRLNHKIPVSKIVPPRWKPKRRMRMVAAGFDKGEDLVIWETMIVETQHHMTEPPFMTGLLCKNMPTLGRSGGGLFTDDNYLAAICCFALPVPDQGLYSGPESLYTLLERNGITAPP